MRRMATGASHPNLTVLSTTLTDPLRWARAPHRGERLYTQIELPGRRSASGESATPVEQLVTYVSVH